MLNRSRFDDVQQSNSGTADFWLVHLKYEAVVADFITCQRWGPHLKKRSFRNRNNALAPMAAPKTEAIRLESPNVPVSFVT